MAFIRRVRTKSGATAVQIAEYVPGGQRIVEHVGSAHTTGELGVLLEKARELIASTQPALDIEVPVQPRVQELVRAPKSQPELAAPVPTVPAGRDGAGRVVGTSSGVLRQVLEAAYSQLGFDVIEDQVFRDLVIARIVEPTSKLDAGRVLEDLGGRPASYSTIKRHLRTVTEDDYRAQIASKCFDHSSTSGDISLVLYDVTTLYFEAENEDELRKVGFSKERRVDPQVVVGLLVDRNGFPLEIGCYEGNKAETHTIVPIVKQFQARHQIADMVVVADAGMLSRENLTTLADAQLRFIVGSRSGKAPGDLAHHFHWNGDAFTDGQLIDTITPHHASTKAKPPNRRAEPVWDPEQHPKHWRAVWSYSRKRAVRDGHTLTAQENKAIAVVAGDAKMKSTRFVKPTASGHVLDKKGLERARGLVGLRGYVTNIPASTMPANEVLASYHELWHVEQSFRMSKTDLRARPMFHRQRDAIEAHLTIVFTALAIARFIQNRTARSINHVLKKLRPLRSADIAINGTTQTIPPQIGTDEKELIAAISDEIFTH